MSQRPPRRRVRSPQAPPPSRQESDTNKVSIVYIIVTAAVVFSMIAAGLSMVDWGGFLGDDPEPTPDYGVNQIATQQAIVDQDPGNAAQQVSLAAMLANSGRMNEAIPVYEQAIKLEPDNVENRLSFAQALDMNGMREDAEAQYLKVIELDPRNHTAHYYLGKMYLSWQPRRTEEGVEHLTRVVEIAPDSFYAEQAQGILDTMGMATPIASPEVSPVATP